MHRKRQTIEKSWPVPRKGTKYLVVASHESKNGLPILIILRDLMKLAKNRKEVKKILGENKVSVNGKTIKKDNLSILPFDLIKIGNKNYEIRFSEKGRFEAKETQREENVLKVIGKKTLKGNKFQLNLIYGKNIITNEKIKVGSSVVIKNKKIIKTIPLEIGREAVILSGKYKGREGKILEIKEKIATIDSEKEKINVPVPGIMIIK